MWWILVVSSKQRSPFWAFVAVLLERLRQNNFFFFFFVEFFGFFLFYALLCTLRNARTQKLSKFGRRSRDSIRQFCEIEFLLFLLPILHCCHQSFPAQVYINAPFVSHDGAILHFEGGSFNSYFPKFKWQYTSRYLSALQQQHSST